MAPEGGLEVGTPLKNYKSIGFIINTGPDPLKITKLPIQHSMFGHPLLAERCWAIVCWRNDVGPSFAGGTMMSHL